MEKIAMHEFKSRSKSYVQRFQLVAFGVMLTFGIGCNDDSTAPLSNVSQTNASGLQKTDDPPQCSTSYDYLNWWQGLTLHSGYDSEVKYKSNSVFSTTWVSFGICDFDPSGTYLTSKKAVFGTNSNQTFFKPLEVKLDLVDAGLPSNTQDDTPFRLYRKNDNTGSWDFVLADETGGNDVKYQISRNGTYAITLANRAVDTTWTATGLIPPSGGNVRLQSSNIVFPQGALTNSTQVSFAMTQATPVGLPGATNRIYNFGPDGIVFHAPVTLYVSFADAGIEGEKVNPLRFYYFNPSTSTWVGQPTGIDWPNQRFIVTLSHFSQYAFGR